MSKKDIIKNPHTFLSETVSGSLQIGIVELASQLIKEYDCKTILEKSLCEIIANSYGRILTSSKLIDRTFGVDAPYRYLNILSKELDRENKNYLTAINTLIEMKRPNMTINVNSENIYLGQNQQFSNNNGKNENIRN